MTFGKKLKYLREERGWSQRKLASELDVSQPLIKYYESDERFPGPDILRKISNNFNVSTDFLLGLVAEKEGSVSGIENIERIKMVIGSNPRLKDYLPIMEKISLKTEEEQLEILSKLRELADK